MPLAFPLDLQPSMAVRLEAAREVLAECQRHADTRDFQRALDLCTRADQVIHGRPVTCGMPHVPLRAFLLQQFIEEHSQAAQ